MFEDLSSPPPPSLLTLASPVRQFERPSRSSVLTSNLRNVLPVYFCLPFVNISDMGEFFLKEYLARKWGRILLVGTQDGLPPSVLRWPPVLTMQIPISERSLAIGFPRIRGRPGSYILARDGFSPIRTRKPRWLADRITSKVPDRYNFLFRRVAFRKIGCVSGTTAIFLISLLTHFVAFGGP